MFDNKMLKVQSAREMLFPRLKSVCVCVCVCVPPRRALKRTSKVHFELQTRPNDQIHTKHVKTAGLESIHLNTVYVLKWTRTAGRKLCVNILFWWQTGASLMLIKEQNAKRKSHTALNLNKVIALSINLSIHTVKTMQCSFTFDHFQIYFVAITYLNINVSRHSWKN